MTRRCLSAGKPMLLLLPDPTLVLQIQQPLQVLVEVEAELELAVRRHPPRRATHRAIVALLLLRRVQRELPAVTVAVERALRSVITIAASCVRRRGLLLLNLTEQHPQHARVCSRGSHGRQARAHERVQQARVGLGHARAPAVGAAARRIVRCTGVRCEE
jgi:hypothetical protein